MHRIRVEIESTLPVVVAEGEVDAFAASDLEAALEEAGRLGNVVIDLRRVSFMDSTALGLVARAVRMRGEAGRLVRVVLPRGSARRIFEITALDGALPVTPSREDGLAELAEKT
ncbi:MAG: STAS domain-containing protein [Gaiellaceae bacterium]